MLTRTSPGRLPFHAIAAVSLLVLALAPCLAGAPEGSGYVSGEILVKLADHARPSLVAQIRQDLGARTIREFVEIGVQHWKLRDGLDVEAALARLRAAPFRDAIVYAEPNYILTADGFPSDPRRGELYGMHNIGQTGGTVDADIDALEAWAVETGFPTVVVAVIDSGMLMTHEDLAASVWTNPGEIPGNGIDDDANGYVDDVHGWDFVNNDNDPTDDNGHGTHTSGTAGAAGDNGKGVAGVAFHVQLMPLKILDARGSGDTAWVVSAVLYANRFVAVKVTNNSYGSSRSSSALRDAIAASRALFACSAGNDGNTRANYPAAYSTTLPNVIAVAATDANDALASFSNYSSSWVNLAAPGVDILSTGVGGSYVRMSGTSMAAPHVAGAAALVASQWSRDPARGDYSGADLRTALQSKVDLLPALSGKTTTGGRLNVAKAVGAPPFPADGTAPARVVDLAATPQSNASIALSWTAPADDAANPGSGPAYLYELRYLAGQPVTDANWATAGKLVPPLPAAPGTAESFTATGLQAGTTYYFSIRTWDEAGNVAPLSDSAQATTDSAGGWATELIDPAPPDFFYASAAFDRTGMAGVAYGTSNAPVRFTRNAGTGWVTETIDNTHGGDGISLAVNPGTDVMTAAYGSSGMWFATRGTSGWTTEKVGNDSGSDSLWLSYDLSSQPAIAYRSALKVNSKLQLARRSAGRWTIETVLPYWRGRVSLAFDPLDGQPSMAYSGVDANGQLGVVYAHKAGSTWQFRQVSTQAGNFVTLRFNPVTFAPTITYSTSPVTSVYLATLDRAQDKWSIETVAPGSYSDHAYAADGTLYVSVSAYGTVTSVAHRAADGTWAVEVADATRWSDFVPSVAVDPMSSLPRVGYCAAGGTWFASRKP